MKVLLINKFHYLRGGAERAYFDTAQILSEHGHDLAFFSMKHPSNVPSRWEKYFVSNADYAKGSLNIFKNIKAIFDLWYNFEAKIKLEKLIVEFKPDVAHLHGVYHQLSPSVIDVLAKHNIPMVMTLHDYKLISPAYNLSVRGSIWEKDKHGQLYKCITDRVVKNSYFKSLICVIEAILHRYLKTYRQIDLFISPSDFLINKFREYGFKGKMIKLPNPVIFENRQNEIDSKENYILYYGRLSEEKGIDDLIRAFALVKSDVGLKIIGAGPEKEKLIKLVHELGISRVEFLGHKNREQLVDHIEKSSFVVMSSRCYENAPYSVLEAMSLGKAVIAPDLGGMKDLINNNINGFLYEPGNKKELASKIDQLYKDRNKAAEMGVNGRKTVEIRNCKDCYYYPLIRIYEQLIDRKKNKV